MGTSKVETDVQALEKMSETQKSCQVGEDGCESLVSER